MNAQAVGHFRQKLEPINEFRECVSALLANTVRNDIIDFLIILSNGYGTIHAQSVTVSFNRATLTGLIVLCLCQTIRRREATQRSSRFHLEKAIVLT